MWYTSWVRDFDLPIAEWYESKIMRSNDVVQALCARVPFKDTWDLGEPYGPYFVRKDVDIKKVLYCVTPTKGVVQQFKDEGHDLLVSHHPYIVKVPQVILHTAMDCCVGGLNDQWRDAVGIKDAKHFDRNLGWYGQIDPIEPDAFYNKVRDFLGHEPIGACFSDKKVIESVVVCSGLGGLVESQALATKADCYIMGQAISDPNGSFFPAIIETGHTLSEYDTGLKVIRNTLEPMGIVVKGADLSVDVFGSEVYKRNTKQDE
jgi:putative NIF3 family GTP cyclohydrolase 1 type 2